MLSGIICPLIRADKGFYVSGEERDKRRVYHKLFPRESIFKTIHCYVKLLLNQTVPLEEFAVWMNVEANLNYLILYYRI